MENTNEIRMDEYNSFNKIYTNQQQKKNIIEISIRGLKFKFVY